MFKIIALIVVALIVAVLLFAASKPDTFRVERSQRIAAPPEKIAALIADFHRWGAWSPYEKLDPAMKRSFSGAASGEGAAYAWESEGRAGVGNMRITGASPEKIAIDLEFIKPFTTSNLIEFTLKPQAGATVVTWSMNGPSPYPAKVMQVLFSMDRMVGRDFEAGLADLKTAAES